MLEVVPSEEETMRTHASIAISVTALVVAVFGSTPIGEAAWNQVVPPNSVGTLQLKSNAVTAAKIAPNAVRTTHILDGSLLASDFKAGQLKVTEGVSTLDPGWPQPTSVTDQLGGPDAVELLSNFSTTRAGRLLLLKDVLAHMNCTSSGLAWWWVTIDGAPVLGSLRWVTAFGHTDDIPISLYGITAQSVPAGQHTLGVGAMCLSGFPGSAGFAGYSAGSVVVLG